MSRIQLAWISVLTQLRDYGLVESNWETLMSKKLLRGNLEILGSNSMIEFMLSELDPY